MLLELGLDINARDESGSTLLMDAATYSYPPPQPAFYKFLVSKGADLNAVDNRGLSLLAMMKKELERQKENEYAVEIYSALIKALREEGAVDK